MSEHDGKVSFWPRVGPSRRQFIRSTALAVTSVAAACADDDVSEATFDAAMTGDALPIDAAATDLPPTPACDEEGTNGDIEGPYYLAEAPFRRVLAVSGLPGAPLALSGRVLDRLCRPLAGYIVDVWHADHEGRYYGFAEAGTLPEPRFNYRGRVIADEQGRYAVDTIVPGLYGTRPRHIHVKVYPPGTSDFERAFTTQLYFPEDVHMAGGFREDLVLRFSDVRTASFDFVIEPL